MRQFEANAFVRMKTVIKQTAEEVTQFGCLDINVI
jgi:hypothetical protein